MTIVAQKSLTPLAYLSANRPILSTKSYALRSRQEKKEHPAMDAPL
jgi:hypothetical protein